MISIARPAAWPRFTEKPRTAVPLPLNVEPLFSLGSDEFFHYRGIPFRVPPVPSRAGAKLMELRTRILNMREASEATHQPTLSELAEYVTLTESVVREITRLIRPVGRVARWRRTLGIWHPFKDASDREIGQLLDFLLRLRAKSSIRFRVTSN